MKPFFIIVIILMAFSSLLGYITSIENIRNETYVIDYDEYRGAIYRYENKLISTLDRKVEEYEIMPSGELSRLSFQEIKDPGYGYLNDDRYYIVDTLTGPNQAQITIFDISSTPMQKIIRLDIEIEVSNLTKMLFTEQHIIMTDRYNGRLILINKDTYQIDGYVEDILDEITHRNIALSGSSLVLYDIIGSVPNNIKLARFYEFLYNSDTNNYDYEQKSELILRNSMSPLYDITIIDDKAVFPCAGCIIIDIEDLENPEIIYDLDIDITFRSALFNDEYVFLSTPNGALYVYTRADSTLVFSDMGYHADYNNMCIQMPYLYMNKGYGMKVYDISNGIEEIYCYGNYYQDSFFSLSENEMYYHYATSQDIYFENNLKYYFYSVFSDDLLFSFESENLRFYHFTIRDDILYVLVYDSITGGSYLHLYEINNQQITFINSLDVDPLMPYYFHLIGNKIFFQSLRLNYVYIYEINENQFTYIGSFPGKIPNSLSSAPQNYILNYNLNRIMVRDIDDYTNILLNQIVVYDEQSTLYYYDDSTFLLHNIGLFYHEAPATYLYSFDLVNPSVNQIYSGNTWANSFNQILTLQDEIAENADFYTISNNQMNHIGSFENPYRQHTRYYFFPERNKLVIQPYSSLRMYDFDYSVSEKDDTIPLVNSKLLGNYPNPFNPETTISFYLSVATDLRVDIYNIKGQKVKSLLNGYQDKGYHEIVWNGLDENGQSVSSGIYFYSLKTDDYSETKKMVLMK